MSSESMRQNTSSAAEQTPLLGTTNLDDGPGNEEVQNAGILTRQYWTLQKLTACSLIFCVTVYVFALCESIVSILLPLSNGSGYWYRYLNEIELIVLYTSIVSILNYAYLRRSGAQLPWALNTIVDFVVTFMGLYYSIIYFFLNVTAPERPCYQLPPDVCSYRVKVYKTIGTFKMIAVLFLVFAHGCLLLIRLRDSQSSNSSRRNSRDGWFCGFGRGPFVIRSGPESESDV